MTAALCFMPVGVLTGVAVVLLAEGRDSYRLAPAWTTLGAILAGYGLWWKLVAGAAAYTRTAGRFAGILIAISMHVLGSAGIFLHTKVCHWTTGGCLGSMGELPPSLLEGLAISLLYGVLTVVFVIGWFTVPACAFIGQWLATKQDARDKAPIDPR